MLSKNLKRIVKSNKAIRERGIETLEWIGLSAVILTLLLGMLTVMPAGGQAIGGQMHSTISNWVEVWSGAGESGADLGGGSFSPGGGDGYEAPGQPGVNAPGFGQPTYGDVYGQPGYAQVDPAVWGAADAYGSGLAPNGRFEAACPDCGPNWLESIVSAGWGYFSPGGSLQSAQEASRIVGQEGGKYVRVYKGAPPDLYAGRYLANNPKIKPYTTGAGALKKHLSGSNWASAGLWSTGVNLIDYKTGLFNPEKKGKPVVSTEFAADVTVDAVAGVLAHAAAAALVTAGIAAAGITAPAWATGLAVVGVTVGMVAGVDWLTCKITGTKATDWAKQQAKNLYDSGVGLVNEGIDGVKGLLGL